MGTPTHQSKTRMPCNINNPTIAIEKKAPCLIEDKRGSFDQIPFLNLILIKYINNPNIPDKDKNSEI